VERFYKTVLNEFYRAIDELQADLDTWIKRYNEQRPHQGRWCNGQDPMQTFIESVLLAPDKLIAARRYLISQ
jgi:hypothetical protein